MYEQRDAQLKQKSSRKSEKEGTQRGPGKCNKPLLEKKRRARINKSLDQLKVLLMEELRNDNPAVYSKLEKADILEMAVNHLRQTQKQENVMSAEENVRVRFKAGFNECAQEVNRYFNTVEKTLDPELRLHLMNHLAGRISPATSSSTHPQDSRSAISTSTTIEQSVPSFAQLQPVATIQQSVPSVAQFQPVATNQQSIPSVAQFQPVATIQPSIPSFAQLQPAATFPQSVHSITQHQQFATIRPTQYAPFIAQFQPTVATIPQSVPTNTPLHHNANNQQSVPSIAQLQQFRRNATATPPYVCPNYENAQSYERHNGGVLTSTPNLGYDTTSQSSSGDSGWDTTSSFQHQSPSENSFMGLLRQADDDSPTMWSSVDSRGNHSSSYFNQHSLSAIVAPSFAREISFGEHRNFMERSYNIDRVAGNANGGHFEGAVRDPRIFANDSLKNVESFSKQNGAKNAAADVKAPVWRPW